MSLPGKVDVQARRPTNGVGIEIEGRRWIVLIPPGAALPVRRSRPFTTVADGQRAVEVRVIRWTRGGQPGGLIGRFLLAGFRAGPRGTARIDIGLSLDNEGIVRAWARDRETGAREDCVFAVHERRNTLAALTGEAEARRGRGRGVTVRTVRGRGGGRV